jgi:hypothetical protein
VVLPTIVDDIAEAVWCRLAPSEVSITVRFTESPYLVQANQDTSVAGNGTVISLVT